MTVVTRDLCVSTVEEKIRLHIVIKQPQIPRDGIVAGLTIVFERAVVRINIDVTARTNCFRVGVDMGLMARRAFEIRVLPEERKMSQAVIEEWDLIPRRFDVAAVALRTFRPFVHIVVSMAGAARIVGRNVMYRFNVTIVACDGLV